VAEMVLFTVLAGLDPKAVVEMPMKRLSELADFFWITDELI